MMASVNWPTGRLNSNKRHGRSKKKAANASDTITAIVAIAPYSIAVPTSNCENCAWHRAHYKECHVKRFICSSGTIEPK